VHPPIHGDFPNFVGWGDAGTPTFSYDINNILKYKKSYSTFNYSLLTLQAVFLTILFNDKPYAIRKQAHGHPKPRLLQTYPQQLWV